MKQEDLNENNLLKLGISKARVLYSDNRIKYKPEYMDPKLFNKVSFPFSKIDGIGSKHSEEFELFYELLKTKGKKFRMELENRLIKLIYSENDRYVKMKLKRVYIGYNVNHKIAQELILLLEKLEIEYSFIDRNDIINYSVDYDIGIVTYSPKNNL